MDLIDRQALLGFLDDITNDEEWLVTQYNADWIYSWIDFAPTVDAVEVVRCKDCKWYGNIWTCPMATKYKCSLPNGFCSYGERRAEE